MKTHTLVSGLLALGLFFGGCANPAPSLTSLDPAWRVAHMPTFTLTVTGEDFVPESVIVFNGVEKLTEHLGSNELSCEIFPEEIALGPDAIPVLVRTPEPGGGDSETLTFTVQSNHTFTPPLYVSNTPDDSTHPNLTVNGEGDLNVVWVDFSAENFEIFHSRSKDGGLDWSSPVNVSNTPSRSEVAAIAAGPEGDLRVVWFEDVAGNLEIYATRSEDEGDSWSTPENVSENPTPSLIPRIAVDGDGTVHVVWHDGPPGQEEVLYRGATDGGDAWGSSLNLSLTPDPSRLPDISADGEGGIHVVWCEDGTGGGAVFYRRSTDGGLVWDPTLQLAATSGVSPDPRIACGSAGTVFVAYLAAGGNDPDVHFIRSSDGGSSWSAPMNVSRTDDESLNPSLAVDSADNLNLVWSEHSAGTFDVLFRRSVDGGFTWTDPKNLSQNASHSIRCRIVADSLGHLGVVWNDNLPGYYGIYFSGSLR